jgi:hypothetical protein
VGVDGKVVVDEVIVEGASLSFCGRHRPIASSLLERAQGLEVGD